MIAAEFSISSLLFLVTAEGDMGERWDLSVVWMMESLRVLPSLTFMNKILQLHL